MGASPIISRHSLNLDVCIINASTWLMDLSSLSLALPLAPSLSLCLKGQITSLALWWNRQLTDVGGKKQTGRFSVCSLLSLSSTKKTAIVGRSLGISEPFLQGWDFPKRRKHWEFEGPGFNPNDILGAMSNSYRKNWGTLIWLEIKTQVPWWTLK